GRIEAQGAPYSGLLDIGRWPSGVDDTAHEVAKALAGAGFVSRAVDDVMRWKYAKLLRNLGNALEALCGAHLDDDGMRVVVDLDARMRAEAEPCLRAAGIAWTGDAGWTAQRRDQGQPAGDEGRRRSGGTSWQRRGRRLGSSEA